MLVYWGLIETVVSVRSVRGALLGQVPIQLELQGVGWGWCGKGSLYLL
jgi:hypothetical protein